MHTPILITAASIFSFIWVLGVILLGDYKNLFDLKANEIGDFLAGAFSPLAFLWFLVAVFMQKLELRQARETHMLQLAEFQESTAANRDIANTGQRDAAINELEKLYNTNLKELTDHFRIIYSKLLGVSRNQPMFDVPVSSGATIENIATNALRTLSKCQGKMLSNSTACLEMEKLERRIIEITEPLKLRYGADNFEAALKTTDLSIYMKQLQELKELTSHKITQFELENSK